MLVTGRYTMARWTEDNSGKPYTLRDVRTVWRRALGNLFMKVNKAPGA